MPGARAKAPSTEELWASTSRLPLTRFAAVGGRRPDVRPVTSTRNDLRLRRYCDSGRP
jgi:hypothetical protein